MKKYFVAFVFAAMLAMFSSAQAAPLAVYYSDDFDEGFMVARVESFSADVIQMAIQNSGMTPKQDGTYTEIDYNNNSVIVIYPPALLNEWGITSNNIKDIGLTIAEDFETFYLYMYDGNSSFFQNFNSITTEITYLTDNLPLISLDINRQLLE